ncbi:MAG: hypothetical protein RL208_720, partial [Pseudomonadota bacterium]
KTNPPPKDPLKPPKDPNKEQREAKLKELQKLIEKLDPKIKKEFTKKINDLEKVDDFLKQAEVLKKEIDAIITGQGEFETLKNQAISELTNFKAEIKNYKFLTKEMIQDITKECEIVIENIKNAKESDKDKITRVPKNIEQYKTKFNQIKEKIENITTQVATLRVLQKEDIVIDYDKENAINIKGNDVWFFEKNKHNEFNITNGQWVQNFDDNIILLDKVQNAIGQKILALKAAKELRDKEERERKKRSEDVSNLTTQFKELRKKINENIGKIPEKTIKEQLENQGLLIEKQLEELKTTDLKFDEKYQNINKAVQSWRTRINEILEQAKTNPPPPKPKDPPGPGQNPPGPGQNNQKENNNNSYQPDSTTKTSIKTAKIPQINNTQKTTTATKNTTKNKIPTASDEECDTDYDTSTSKKTHNNKKPKWDTLDTILLVLLTLATLIGGLIYWYITKKEIDNKEAKKNLNTTNQQQSQKTR